MVETFMKNPAIGGWFQAALGSLPDLERLLPKAVALFTRFKRWVQTISWLEKSCCVRCAISMVYAGGAEVISPTLMRS